MVHREKQSIDETTGKGRDGVHCLRVYRSADSASTCIASSGAGSGSRQLRENQAEGCSGGDRHQEKTSGRCE